MGLAFEVHDSRCCGTRKTSNIKSKDTKEELLLEKELKSIETPTAQDIFHYAFCHAGILTGNVSR